MRPLTLFTFVVRRWLSAARSLEAASDVGAHLIPAPACRATSLVPFGAERALEAVVPRRVLGAVLLARSVAEHHRRLDVIPRDRARVGAEALRIGLALRRDLLLAGHLPNGVADVLIEIPSASVDAGDARIGLGAREGSAQA